MRISINGEEKTLSEPMTVAQLLATRGLSKAPCAVEINRLLVPKHRHEQQSLQDGDAVEIVTLVGGG